MYVNREVQQCSDGHGSQKMVVVVVEVPDTLFCCTVYEVRTRAYSNRFACMYSTNIYVLVDIV